MSNIAEYYSPVLLDMWKAAAQKQADDDRRLLGEPKEDATLSRVYSVDPPKAPAPCWYCGAEGHYELDCQLFEDDEDDEIGF